MTESEIKGRKRVVWDKTETASLIDLVFKNPAIWNTKSKEYIQGGAGNVAALCMVSACAPRKPR